jgi:TolA-binding protein
MTKASLLLLASVSLAIAGEIEMADGTKMQGKILRVIPAQVEIETPHGVVKLPETALKKVVQKSEVKQTAVPSPELDDLKKTLERREHLISLQKQLIETLKQQVDLANDATRQAGGRPIAVTPTPIPSDDGEIPATVLSRLKSKAAVDHPGDPSTQLYVVKTNVEAWKKLKTFPDSSTKRKAAEDFPLDFSTQLYVVEEAQKAERDLSNIR